MKIVIDTNVYISALVFNKKVQEILEIILEQHTVYISPFIIEEIKEKLKIKFKFDLEAINLLVTALLLITKLEEPKGELPTKSKDTDDNNILLLAEFIKADLIISGDKDLFKLISFKNIRILKPADFFEH